MNRTIKNRGKYRSKDKRAVLIRSEHNGLGALKTLMVAFLLISQIALLFYLYFSFVAAFRRYLMVSFLLSFLTCIYVLSSSKNAQSKAVWIIFLLLGFSFGYVVYFLSDENIFFGRAKRKYRKIFRQTDDLLSYETLDLPPAIRNHGEHLRRVGNFPAYRDTAIRYFSSGSQLFDDVLTRLTQAEHFIFIEYFIISDGALLTRISRILEEKARQGVDIRIIYDDMGCHRTLSRKTKKRLRQAGIRMHEFNRLLTRFSVALNYRDHRKMILIDGKTAYTGGSNLADEYINEKRMYGYWKDTGLRLDGSAVDSFTRTFLRQWEYVSKRPTEYAPFFGHAQRQPSSSVVIPYADGLDYDIPVGKNVYTNLIASAQKKLYIMTPYFIPDSTIAELLCNQAMSGVDVRLLLPGIPDKRMVYTLSRNNAERMLESGVRLYCMKNAFVHSKVLLTESAAVVGSINMDLRSFYQQFECAVLSDDPGFLADIQKDFDTTFPDCEEITKKNQRRNNPLNRFWAGLLRLVAPLM